MDDTHLERHPLSDYLPTKPCHNCRRRRWKCDYSLPSCNKCRSSGQECLGYGKLLLWATGVATRGKMMGKSFEQFRNGESRPVSLSSVIRTDYSERPSLGAICHEKNRPVDRILRIHKELEDPLFQNLSNASRFYLFYYDRQVCKDLVIHDLPNQNPFRGLLNMVRDHPVLLHIIVANSALHLANSTYTPPQCLRGHFTSGSENLQSVGSFLLRKSSNAYRDALIAKQKALYLLFGKLQNTDSTDVDVVLASIMLFIKLEMLDTGKNEWRFHVDGARQLIAHLHRNRGVECSTASDLRNFLIDNCAMYAIIGGSLSNVHTANLEKQDGPYFDLNNTMVSYREQANSCLSCPPVLLQTIRDITSCLHHHLPETHNKIYNPTSALLVVARDQILSTVDDFNPMTWATSLQHLTPFPASDLETRTHIASAYKAAVKIYCLRALDLLQPFSVTQNTLPKSGSIPESLTVPEVSTDLLVAQIIEELDYIAPSNSFFKATCWPTFIAGAETRDRRQRAWVKERFEQAWKILPWGYLGGALEVLDVLWTDGNRQKSQCTGESSWEDMEQKEGDAYGRERNWIEDVRGLETDWLIA